MASPSDSRLYLETTPCSIRAALVTGNKVTAYGEFSPDAKDSLAAFVAKHSSGSQGVALVIPDQVQMILSDADQASGSRDRKAWESIASSLGAEFDAPLKVTVCDAHEGTAPTASGNSPWLLTVSPEAALTEAGSILADAGLAPASVRQILPAQLGAVALSLQLSDSPDEVLLISIGRTSSVLARVTAQGVQALTVHPAGVDQLFDAVQAGLGLKFKAAAVKLFFNEAYDFTDTADAIAGTLAETFKPAIATLGGSPSVLQLVSLLDPQKWLESALAGKLGLVSFKADPLGLAHSNALIAEGLPHGAIGLLQAIAGHSSSLCSWLPTAIDEMPAPAAKPAPAVIAPPAAPEPAPAPQKAATPAPFPKPAPAPAPAPVPAPAPAPAPASAPKPVVAAPASKPKAQGKSKSTPPKPPAPVPRPASPAPAPAPAPSPVTAVPFEAPASTDTPAAGSPAAAGKSGKMVGIIAAVVVVLIVVVIGAKMFSGGGVSEEEAARLAALEMARSAEMVKFRELKLSMLRSEIARDRLSFKNAYYSFEVADKGYIRKLTNAADQPLVDSAGAVNLQGSYVSPDGRRVWFYAGGVGNTTYTATVEKTIVDLDIVFKIKVTHPSFELNQTITCLERSIKVAVDFTPIKLKDERGSINAIYAIQFWPSALNSRQSVNSAPGVVEYPTQTGAFKINYGGKIWQTSEKTDGQLVNVGDTGTSFYFGDSAEENHRKLNYELILP